MPIRSPGDVPAPAVRDLGLPPRAVTALARAGISGVDQLASLTREDLAGIAGLGPGSVAAIRRVVPEPAPEPERESPDVPAIPSFDSLRAPHRRSALDLLVPGAPPAGPPATPRPAEYADLLRLGARVLRAGATVPIRVARWSLREPVHLLRRLLG